MISYGGSSLLSTLTSLGLLLSVSETLLDEVHHGRRWNGRAHDSGTRGGPRARRRGHEPVFIGTRQAMEAKLVPAAGFPIEWIEIGGLNRVGLRRRSARCGSFR